MENIEYFCDDCKVSLTLEELETMLANSYNFFHSEKIKFIEKLMEAKNENINSPLNFTILLSGCDVQDNGSDNEVTRFKLTKLN